MIAAIAKPTIIAAKDYRSKDVFSIRAVSKEGLSAAGNAPDFSCDKDMFNEQHLRLKTFVKCIKEDGTEKFSAYILRNHNDGVAYHKNGYTGDYDLDTEEAILSLLRNGK